MFGMNFWIKMISRRENYIGLHWITLDIRQGGRGQKEACREIPNPQAWDAEGPYVSPQL